MPTHTEQANSTNRWKSPECCCCFGKSTKKITNKLSNLDPVSHILWVLLISQSAQSFPNQADPSVRPDELHRLMTPIHTGRASVAANLR